MNLKPLLIVAVMAASISFVSCEETKKQPTDADIVVDEDPTDDTDSDLGDDDYLDIMMTDSKKLIAIAEEQNAPYIEEFIIAECSKDVDMTAEQSMICELAPAEKVMATLGKRKPRRPKPKPCTVSQCEILFAANTQFLRSFMIEKNAELYVENEDGMQVNAPVSTFEGGPNGDRYYAFEKPLQVGDIIRVKLRVDNKLLDTDISVRVGKM